MKKAYSVHSAVLFLTSFATLGSTSRCEDELKDSIHQNTDQSSTEDTSSSSKGNTPGQEIPPAPTAPQYTIKKVMTNGTGCGPDQPAVVNLDESSQALKIAFPAFQVETGPELQPMQARKNCVITLVASVPDGYQYAIRTLGTRGYISLDENVKLTHAASIFFEGQGKTDNLANEKIGPFSSDYVFNDSLDFTSMSWSPCGVARALNVNLSLRVSRGQGTTDTAVGLGTLDEMSISLMLRKCR